MKSVDATALIGAEEPTQGYAFAVGAGSYAAQARPNVYSPGLPNLNTPLKNGRAYSRRCSASGRRRFIVDAVFLKFAGIVFFDMYGCIVKQ